MIANTDEKVSSFFTTDRKRWDEQRVRNTFLGVDAEHMLATRIPTNHAHDKLAWVHSSCGRYNVRSGIIISAAQIMEFPNLNVQDMETDYFTQNKDLL